MPKDSSINDRSGSSSDDYYVSHTSIINTQTRIAVLEKIAESHENRISDIEDFHRAVVERFDQKIQLDATNQVIMERTLAKAVVSIDSLSENLRSTVDMAKQASKLAVKHEIVGQTIFKIAGYIGIIMASLWAVATYFKII